LSVNLAQKKGVRERIQQQCDELKTKIDEAKRNYNKWLMEEISFKQQIENLKEVERNCLKSLSELTPDPLKEAKLHKTNMLTLPATCQMR
jgi:small-conductance mechanosensitive channel